MSSPSSSPDSSIPAGFASSLRSDVFAGIVVFLVALPLCLGISSASGVEPIAGLLAGVIGGTVVTLFSGSRLSVSGPAAGLVVIVVEATDLAGGFPSFMTAVIIAGVLQMVFGLLRVGKLASYVPTAVVNGMLAAIGLLLIIQQAPVALGLHGAVSDAEALGAARYALFGLPLGAMVVAFVALALLFIWASPMLQKFRFVRAVPAPLLVVTWGIAYSFVTSQWLPSLSISPSAHIMLPRIDSLGTLAGALTLPTAAALGNVEVWEMGVTIAIVASLETLLSLAAVSRIDPRREVAPPNRELGAQGLGNVLAGALGALPVTSVIVRSSANVHAGASTRLAAIIHGLLLLLSLFLLVDLLNFVPLACLAAILIHTGYKLASPRLFVGAWRTGFAHWGPFVATIAGVLATDLLIGIAIGLTISAVIALESHRRESISLTSHDNHFLLRFQKDLSFLAKVSLERHLSEVPADGVLIIDGTGARYIDPDVRSALSEKIDEARRRGVQVELRNLELPTTRAAAPSH